MSLPLFTQSLHTATKPALPNACCMPRSQVKQMSSNKQYQERKMSEATDLDSDLFELAMSAKAQPLMDAVKKHIAENVEPIIGSSTP